MQRNHPGPMIPLEEALGIVLDRTERLPAAEAPLPQALGGVLAETVLTDRDYPPFAKSAMDGFAVASQDTAEAPRTLRVVEEIRAGVAPTLPVGSGEASAIMTGAPVPPGADAVVPVEETDPAGAGKVVILSPARPGQHVCQRGEDRKKGEVALPKGARIRPEEMAVLAAVGRDRVSTYGRPRATILSTGDELVETATTPGPHQIRSSNDHALQAQCRWMGIEARRMGIAPDRKEAIREMVAEALQADLVLISGGVSMGEYDLVGEVLFSLGLQVGFQRVAVKPGKPTLFGTIQEKPVFGLPGNPVSGFVIFHLLVRPAIQKQMGVRDPRWGEVEAILEGGGLKPARRWQFFPAALRRDGGGWKVRRVPWKGSGDFFGPSRGNSLLHIPVDSPPLQPGDRVRVLPLSTFEAGAHGAG